ncbi:hypothetical protein [Nannocystis sp.]|uniref:hypothetical protein n=1 Tax=Nannocystis sp. TaxID=1962667 RepID=UPI0025FC4A9C|nr:hypothetical protein [Nannocystis sp.]MBK7828864.1 hypothetical protein [Nannocystis sp.]
MTTSKKLRAWVMTIGAVFCGAAPVGSEAQAARVEAEVTAIADAMLASIHDLRTLAALATAADPHVAALARQRLRAAGPAGLAAFTELHADALATALRPRADAGALARMLGLSAGTGPSAAELQLQDSLDEICAQRDCAAARLYWYTDLEQAKAAARASGKPIVSLRLLGDLRDELSCANSRFFRALLYPDPAVAALLQTEFVLHWQSERPAPKITIDFGDGRSIESTITGNSAHHVLDQDGRPVDVLPGLTTPKTFIADLQRAAQLARSSAGLSPTARAAALRSHHAARLADLERRFNAELAAIGQGPRRMGQGGRLEAAPRAGRAAPIAVSKARIEVPMLGALGEDVERLSDEELWARLGERRLAELELSSASLSLLRKQQWRSGDAAQDAADFERALADLRGAVALDTVRNEFDLHQRIHRWFVADAASLDLEALNRRVYNELFLTPRSDPWLGLAAPTIYTGLVGGGRRVQARL